jgi:hypothetical protein
MIETLEKAEQTEERTDGAEWSVGGIGKSGDAK